jgi:hypothetical protein
MELTVNRAVFVIDGLDSKQISNAVGFEDITVEKFARIAFSPEKLEVANPVQYSQAEDSYPESAWTSLMVTAPVVITGEDNALQPAVTLESATPGLLAAGMLDRVWARPGSEVSLEVRGVQTLSLVIQVNRQESSAFLSFREPFLLFTDFGKVSGITGLLHQADSLTYRAQLPHHNPLVEVTGQPQSLVLILTITPQKFTNLFSKGDISVANLDFTRRNSQGAPESTLVKDGTITYPDYPKIGRVSFKATDFIGLDRLEKFRIEKIDFYSEHKAMHFRLDGIADHVKTGPFQFARDHRLTRFDTLWQNTKLTVLFGVIVWVFPTTVGAYRLLKEIKEK